MPSLRSFGHASGRTCALALFFISRSSFGQGVPILQRGSVEVAAFGVSVLGSGLGGVNVSSSGLPNGNGTFAIGSPSSNGGGGFQAAWALRPTLRIYGEWAYIAGGRDNFNSNYIVAATNPSTRQVSVNAVTSFDDVIGGVQFLFPIRRIPRIVPNLSFGMGYIGLRGGGSASVIGEAPGQIFSGTIKGRNLVGSGALGVRYYFSERAGLRLEVGGLYGPQAKLSGGLTGLAPKGAPHLERFLYAFFYQIR